MVGGGGVHSFNLSLWRYGRRGLGGGDGIVGASCSPPFFVICSSLSFYHFLSLSLTLTVFVFERVCRTYFEVLCVGIFQHHCIIL